MIDINNIKNLSPYELEKVKNDYKNYEGIIFDNDTLYNPLASIPKELEDSPHLYYSWLLSNTDYLSFFCKEILNVQPLLYQQCILKELWNRKFPMLIGTRGMGKAISPDELVRVKNGWKKIRELNIGDQVYSSNGKLCNVVYITPIQNDLNFYEIKLEDGRSIECCEDHQWKIVYKRLSKVLTTKELLEKYNTQDCYIPNTSSLQEDDQDNLILHPYIIGVLLGKGCLVRKTITISTEDQEMVNRIDNLLPDGYKLLYKVGNKYEIHRLNNSKRAFKNICQDIGLFPLKVKNKFIPECVKYSNHNIKLELLKGLMDSSGFIKNGKIVFRHPSDILTEDVLDLGRSLGIPCKKRFTKNKYDKVHHDCYEITFNTTYKIFHSLYKILDFKYDWTDYQPPSKTKIVSIKPIGKKDGMCISVDSPDRTYITKNYIVTHNTFLLSVYILLRATILQGRKIVVAGSGFRQSKLVYEYCSSIWNQAPVLRSAISGYGTKVGPIGGTDSVYFYIGDSKITFIPVGTGQTIRGLRANDIIVDEFSSHSREIFENVIAGFAAVEGSPHEKVSSALEKEFNELFGVEEEIKDDKLNISNQIIISGTAYYHFNHFADYWQKWHDIITSKGDPDKLKNIFPDGIEEGFDWRDYSIIRLPYDLLPKKYMDAGNIARSKATLNSTLFQMEMQAVFSRDSDGFFKASLIESCVANPKNGITKSSGIINFLPMLTGNAKKEYYMGVDTASQFDNFAIVILEINEDHRRVVYCWTTNAKKFKESQKGGVEETDFFRYCSRKIRDLMLRFNIKCIAIDSQGGGRTIYESLHDKQSLKNGEQMIWERIDPEKRKDTDAEEGLHIIDMVNFRKTEYTSVANHGLKKDLEEKLCLFPEYNPAILATYANINHAFAIEMESCIDDIEELKKELSQIVVTASATGLERFDTPEIKISGSEKGRYMKDRYSALLMANMSARTDYVSTNNFTNRSIGEIANQSLNRSDVDFIGPAWLTNKYKGLYD